MLSNCLFWPRGELSRNHTRTVPVYLFHRLSEAGRHQKAFLVLWQKLAQGDCRWGWPASGSTWRRMQPPAQPTMLAEWSSSPRWAAVAHPGPVRCTACKLGCSTAASKDQSQDMGLRIVMLCKIHMHIAAWECCLQTSVRGWRSMMRPRTAPHACHPAGLAGAAIALRPDLLHDCMSYQQPPNPCILTLNHPQKPGLRSGPPEAADS